LRKKLVLSTSGQKLLRGKRDLATESADFVKPFHADEAVMIVAHDKKYPCVLHLVECAPEVFAVQ
jgi:hypothetical protein